MNIISSKLFTGTTNIMRSNSFIVLALVFLTSLVYVSTLSFDFTSWDDNYYVVGNRFIKDFSFDGLVKLWTERTGLGGTRLTLTSFMLDYRLWGLNPKYYHAENVLWHILNAVLLFYLILRISANKKIALVTSFIFALHPMHVESVAWISERKDVLYTFFLLLCLHAYISYVREGKVGLKALYWISFMLCFLLSWHSKFSAIVIPALLFLLDYALMRKFSIWLIVEKLPLLWFAGSEVYRIAFGESARMDFQGRKMIPSFHATYRYSFFQKILLASYSLLFYLIRFLFPVKLSAIIPYPVKVHGQFPPEYYIAFALSIILITGALSALYFFRKNRREYIFGGLFFLVSISIFLHFVSIKGVVVVADRYTYVPYIGLSYVLGVFLSGMENKRLNNLAWIAFGLFIFCLAVLSFQRTKVWKNDITLFSDVLEKDPDVVEALNNRGNAYNKLGKYELAISDFNHGLKLQPDYRLIYNNRAQSYHQLDSNYLALKDLNTAIRLDPNFLDAHINKAQLLDALNKTDKAIETYTKAIKLAPYKAKIFVARAALYMKLDSTAAALDDYNTALGLYPEYFEAYYERGRMWVKNEKPQEALNDFLLAKRIKPEKAEVYNEIGNIYNKMNLFDKALVNLNTSLRYNPLLAEAYNNRGITNFNLQQRGDALVDFNRALELDSALEEAYSNRGNLYALAKDFNRAIEDYNRAIGLDPDDCITLANRGNAYYESGYKEAACEDWQKAINCGFELSAPYFETHCR